MHLNHNSFVRIFLIIIICEINYNECYDYFNGQDYYDPGYRPRDGRPSGIRNYASNEPDTQPTTNNEPGAPQVKRKKIGTRRTVTRVQNGIKFGILKEGESKPISYENAFEAGVAAAKSVKDVGGDKALQEFAKGVATFAASDQVLDKQGDNQEKGIKTFSSFGQWSDDFDDNDDDQGRFYGIDRKRDGKYRGREP